jgi:hypothetical protein
LPTKYLEKRYELLQKKEPFRNGYMWGGFGDMFGVDIKVLITRLTPDF